MQPLYTDAEFKASKSKQFLPLRCLHCNKPFHRTKHIIQIAILRYPQKTADFCSNSCCQRHTTPLVPFFCQQCNKPISKTPSQSIRSPNHFCCQSCAAKWNNAHKKHGTRVSKLECWLQQQLPLLYPDLEFHFNRTDAINAELDIFMPSLRLAFELNGIFHYEPIYGPEKLSRMQTNDSRKSQACFERGIELCIIDTSHQKYFKEPSAMKFLDIIKNIINSKLSGSSPVIPDCLASTT